MKIKYFFLLSVIGIFASCSNDDELKNNDPDEVALFLSSSVATETFGLNALISESADMQNEVIGGRNSVCDYTDAGEYSVSSEPDASVSFSYGYEYSVAVNCEFQIPTSLDVDFNYTGEFEGPQLIWSHQGTGDFTITQNNAETLRYDGTYDRSGEFELKNFERDGSSEVNLTFSELIVSPENEQIISGTGTFTIRVVRNARTYTASGTIIFNGDNTATLEFDDNTITFNIINGTRS